MEGLSFVLVLRHRSDSGSLRIPPVQPAKIWPFSKLWVFSAGSNGVGGCISTGTVVPV